jgi:hypothetical protein
MRGEVKEVYKFLTMILISLTTDHHYELRYPKEILNKKPVEMSLTNNRQSLNHYNRQPFWHFLMEN